MRILKYVLLTMIVVALISTGGCGLFDRTAPNAVSGPIDREWIPVYIDQQVGQLLSTEELVNRLAPTVVSIVTERTGRDFFFQPVPERGAGTGVIIDEAGYIVTNSHVIEGAHTITVTLSDGRTFEAVNWAMDPWSDLAVLSIDAPNDLEVARFLDNSLGQLSRLESVVAVGNALALPGGPTWTRGVVSNLGRSIRLTDNIVLNDLIQTDAAINPGNSGGPLVNEAGQVVGINTAIAANAQGIGFAISTDTVIPVVYHLIREAQVPSAWMGVMVVTVTPSIREQHDLHAEAGALIMEVVENGPADRAGLRSGDVVVRLGGEDIEDSGDLVRAIRAHDAGDVVEVDFWRGEELMTAQITLVQRPE